MLAFRAAVAVLCLLIAACAGTPNKNPAPAPAASAAKPAEAEVAPEPVAAAPVPPPPVAAPPVAPLAPVPPPVAASPPPIPAPPPAVPPAPRPPVAVAPVLPKPPAPAKPVAPAPPPVAATPMPPAPPVAKPVAVVGGLSGHVQLVVGSGQSVDADEVADAVVYFIPDAGAPHPKPGRFQIFTRDKQFDPGSIVIPLGSSVGFPNNDEILHNVFSVTPGSEFDLGLYGEGGNAEFTFRKAGAVTVNCNVHHSMQASILVVDTPYYVHPTKAGDFQIGGVPAGSGKLMLWHPRAGLQMLPVSTPSTAPIEMQLALTKPRVAPHLNKEHKKYLPSRN